MKQPTKDVLRDQLALAAKKIIALKHEREWLYRYIARMQQPWWRRWIR